LINALQQEGRTDMRHSRQRDAIYNYLKDRKDHPTAEAVYLGVKESCPKLSLGTVYRNLMLLRDSGSVRTVDVGDGAVHFDPDTSAHSHFICTECGRVEDIPAEGIARITKAASACFTGRIEGCNCYFYGICQSCLSKQDPVR
jgi:Fur family peroxide stress response transcriptional regulator